MVLKEDVGGSETHETNALPGQSDTRRNENRPSSVFTNRDPDLVSATSQDDGATSVSWPKHYISRQNNPYQLSFLGNGRSSTDQISVHQTEDDGAIGHPPTQAGQDESQAEAQTRSELPRSQGVCFYLVSGRF